MTEDDARAWVADGFGARAVDLIDHYVALLTVEADQQNLIAASTIGSVWARHIVDSAQLVPLVSTRREGAWVDIGSGAGLPGLVVAVLTERPIHLIEPRRLRVEFLAHCIAELGLERRVQVHMAKSQNVALQQPAAVISARAVAALPQLIAGAIHLADADTLWVLPKGERARSEVADAKRTWQGMFHVKHSLVDPVSGIVVASQIARR